MTDFETAARKAAKAAFDVIRHIIAEHPDLFEKTNETHWAARDVLEIEITKHYADLAETFGLLCELARATKLFVMAHDNLETEKALNRSNYNTDIEDIAYIGKAVAGTELRDLLANPRIAALLAEKG